MQNYKQIAAEVLRLEAAELSACADRIDDSFERAVEAIYAIKGKLVIIGVGKSGLVGAKIAATMASTGTPSFFIHPTEAMHGDLGMISKEDGVLAISYSGESEELVAILPHLKRHGVRLVAMSRDSGSSLASFADIHLNIAVSKEACPLNAAPTSSTTLTMALGDALAVALMKKRGFKKEDFAYFHPGGTLGKRLFVKVKDIMRSENLPIVSCETILKEAIIKMSEGKIGSVIFENDGKLAGVLSDGDLRRALMDESFSLDKKAFSYASKNPKSINDENILAVDALNTIETNKIQLLVVTDECGTIKGALHIHDLVEAGIKR
ncbi:MAG: KpsF/GutQ family sugar-phosphate isomerase [Campylobacteraceae bacterium]|jgi:arabinose-5-phosphate isomerase|nr:KpsF/GutQ family sugar-phosphate isomerase [Campylobacteraceae bacterium]